MLPCLARNVNGKQLYCFGCFNLLTYIMDTSLRSGSLFWLALLKCFFTASSSWSLILFAKFLVSDSFWSNIMVRLKLIITMSWLVLSPLIGSLLLGLNALYSPKYPLICKLLTAFKNFQLAIPSNNWSTLLTLFSFPAKQFVRNCFISPKDIQIHIKCIIF